MPIYEIGRGQYEIGDELVGDDYDEFDVGEYDDEEIEELLGADDDDYDDDEVGVRLPFGRRMFRRPKRRRPGRAMVARPRRLPRAMAQAVAQRRVRSMAVLKTADPDKPRQYPLGFDSVTMVAAGATSQITSRPQVLFRPERLVLSQAAAPAFLVNDLIVGKNSQFAAAGTLPGDAFGPTAFGVRLRCDTAQISNDVVLDVTNISAGALRFNAAIFGDVVEY